MTSTAPVYPAQNQWLLAEDEAVKGLVAQVTAPDDKGVVKPVPVWFRFPEQERQITYPFITIDLVGIEPAYDLWTSEYDMDEDFASFDDEYTGAPNHTGLYDPSVNESVVNPDSGVDPSMPIRRPHYLEYRLYYQISSWSKTFAHDRVMTSQLFREIVKPRPCWLKVMADHTWRRMEPLGWNTADIQTQEGGIKRIFRKIFTLSVQAPIAQDHLPDIEQHIAVQKVLLRGLVLDTGEYWTEDETTDHWEQIAPSDTP